MIHIAIHVNTSKPLALQWAEYTIRRLLSKSSTTCYLAYDVLPFFEQEVQDLVKPTTIEQFPKYADIIICFGGDGTILRIAKHLVEDTIPIMGVNVGHLGFLAEFSIAELDDAIENVMKGSYRIVDRSVLETNFKGKKYYAINEFVVEKSGSSRMLTLQTHINRHHVADYRSDGVILTTPSGSTAYSLSCGGPILTPSTQVLGITPISPHTLTVRPLIISDSSEVTFTLLSNVAEANIVADGTVIGTLQHLDAIKIKKSEFVVKLIKRSDTTYFDLLRTKLLWSLDATDMHLKNKVT